MSIIDKIKGGNVMSSTNKTTNYELSQFIGSDKPAWLVDYNGDMSKIDNQMKANADAAASAASQASSAGTAASGAADGVQALNTQINGAGGIASDLVAVQGSINTINSLIGNGEPTTQDKTIIGAINEIYVEIGSGSGVAAEDVTYSNSSSGLTATDVQAAIDEVNGKIPSLPAATSEVKTGTLAAGATSVTLDFTQQTIGAATLIDVYTGTFGVNPTNVTYTASSVALTFAAQATAITVAVKVQN